MVTPEVVTLVILPIRFAGYILLFIMASEFNTTDYEFSNGMKPRGVGHWAFSMRRNPQPDQLFWARGCDYRTAKAQARKFWAEATPAVIYVQP